MKREILSISYTITAEALEGPEGEDYEAKYLLKNCYRRLGETYARENAKIHTLYSFEDKHGDRWDFTNKEDGLKDSRLQFVEKKVTLVL